MNKRFLGPVLALLAVAAIAPRASAVSIGVEAFGGLAVPILQDDSDQGTAFGVRLPVSVLSLLTAEPWYVKSTLGDKTQTIAGLSYTRDGGTLSGYGLNARLGGMSGPGLSLFPYAGIGHYKLERSGADDVTGAGYDLGLGLTLTPVPKFGIGLRGQFDLIPTDGTSRKYGEATVGLSYSFLSLP